jgi:hypothetical protein
MPEYLKSKGQYVHRLVWEAHYGPIPRGLHVHHRNHDKRDNRIENLQLVQHGAHISQHQTGKIWLCPECQDPKAQHAAFGLCKSCYDRRYRLARREELRRKKRVDYLAKWEQRKAKARAYYETHREQAKASSRRAYQKKRTAALAAGVMQKPRMLKS